MNLAPDSISYASWVSASLRLRLDCCLLFVTESLSSLDEVAVREGH